MAGLFQQIQGNVSEQQIQEIVKTGKVPSNLKSAEDKVYTVIFRSYLSILQSSISEDTDISGEAIIAAGRRNIFEKIKNYLYNDAAQEVDVRTSIVMVEGVDAGNAVSLYRFIKLCNQAYSDDPFDDDMLEQYLSGFNDEEEFRRREATGFGGNAGTIMNTEEE